MVGLFLAAFFLATALSLSCGKKATHLYSDILYGEQMKDIAFAQIWMLVRGSHRHLDERRRQRRADKPANYEGEGCEEAELVHLDAHARQHHQPLPFSSLPLAFRIKHHS
jgi:hypothetical protein